ncbi:MAG: DUF4038 domain-containing protein, partial [Sedimentisphaerales bacterium]|nr:DUF4038 domain-containing protein [Sedimentisphaerales bacterium]
IGTDKEGGKTRKPPRSPYTEALRDEFPNDIGSDADAPDALDVYRRALAGAPDGSVTICSVGAMSNLEDLLRLHRDLIVKKVKNLVVMGGQFPDSRVNRPETNVVIDVPAAKYVIENWPGEILFSGFEVGKKIHAGGALLSVTKRNPVRRAFELWSYRSKRGVNNGKEAYDQTAVLLAVRGSEPKYWDVVRGGYVEVSDEGHTRWMEDPDGKHTWVKIKQYPLILKDIIDRLMAKPPRLNPGLQVPGLLHVGDDGPMLVREDGSPFLWLGDTAWSIFNQSRKEDTENDRSVEQYFENRVKKGFTVIQSHLLVNLVRGPINSPNVYGHEPFENGDFTKPRIVPGPDNDYWDYADYLITRAGEYGLYMAIIAAWMNSLDDDHPMVKDPSVAYRYGYFLGERYRDYTHIIWLMGGDPNRERRENHPNRLAMTRAQAEGIADGFNGDWGFDGKADYTTTLMSFHPGGGGWSSSTFLHDEEWLDFNMIQTTSRYRFRNYETVTADYQRTPPKPTFDSEVAYEYSISLNQREKQQYPGRRVTAWDVRRGAYWNLFAGGCGHTYGHRSFIGWVRAGESPLKHGADRPWFESLDAPGSQQMSYLRRLMESRPMLHRIPDQGLIAGDPGEYETRIQATRAKNGKYAFIYVANGRKFDVDLSRLSGSEIQAWWFNPRDGKTYDTGGTMARKPFAELSKKGERTFAPPSAGEGQDWVLVLDDASWRFCAPGESRMCFPPSATAADHNWSMCCPEEEGIDSVKLQQAMQFFEDALDDPKTPDDQEDGIKYACVLRNGRMIWPNRTTPTGQGADLNHPCQIYSATKTFGTGVLGLLVDQGLADLDMRANAIVDIDLTQEDGRGEKEYPSYDEITLRHLATFTDGFMDVRPKWPDTGMYFPFDPQPPRFTPPGSKYAYNSSPQLLSYCMTKLIYNHFSQPPYSWSKAKCNLDHYFETFVADKIGMARTHWRWSNEFPNPGEYTIDLSNPEGLDVRPISQSIFMSAGAMARWGHLFLNRGNWNGKQIISRSYVDEATMIQVPKEIEPDNPKAGYREAPGRYGYMWWINGYGGWTAKGPTQPPVLRWPDAPERTGPTTGVYAASGYLTNICVVIHTLNTADGEGPANMVVVRLTRGVMPDGRKSTPGSFTSGEYNRFLKMLGEAILPE